MKSLYNSTFFTSFARALTESFADATRLFLPTFDGDELYYEALGRDAIRVLFVGSALGLDNDDAPVGTVNRIELFNPGLSNPAVIIQGLVLDATTLFARALAVQNGNGSIENADFRTLPFLNFVELFEPLTSKGGAGRQVIDVSLGSLGASGGGANDRFALLLPDVETPDGFVGPVIRGQKGKKDLLLLEQIDEAPKGTLGYRVSLDEGTVERIVKGDDVQIASVAGIEYARASDLNDNLNGNDLANKLWGQGGNDFIFGNGGNDTLLGGNGRDFLDGGDGKDTLSGGAQRDILDGGNGDDTLDGGAGRDALYGGAGDDVLTGGKSADRFIFEFDTDDDGEVDQLGSDRITDFELGVDKIILEADYSQAEVDVSQVSGGTLINHPQGQILLEGLQLSEAQVFQSVLNLPPTDQDQSLLF